jgi:hypothetical protein
MLIVARRANAFVCPWSIPTRLVSRNPAAEWGIARANECKLSIDHDYEAPLAQNGYLAQNASA